MPQCNVARLQYPISFIFHSVKMQCIELNTPITTATPVLPSHGPALNLLLALKAAPYFHSKNGAGHPITIETMASTVPPIPYPKFSYMVGANNGNPNPAKLRSTVMAPTA